MTEQEYDEQIEIINDRYEKKEINSHEYRTEIRDLFKRYCDSNNTYKVNDVVSDYKGEIRIERIEYGFPFPGKYPCCVYIGKELNDSSNKRFSERRIWQTSILLNEEVNI